METNSRPRADECARVGDSVEVYGPAELGLHFGACRVVDVREDCIVVTAPRFATWSELNGSPVRLTRNAETGIFLVHAEVAVESPALGLLLRLRLIEPWRKIQRRENVRLPADLPIQHALLLRGEEALSLNARIVNVSASGCLLRVTPLPPANARVRLSFELPDGLAPIETDAIVVRVEPDDTPRSKAGRAALHFDSPSARIQDRIVRYIFKEQIRRLRAK